VRELLVVALLGYALAATAAGPRWLLRADWQSWAPRTAITAWLALVFSVIMAWFEAAVIIELPVVPHSLRPSAMHASLAVSVHLQFRSTAGAVAGTAAAAFLLAGTVRVTWSAARAWSAARVSRSHHVRGLALVARPGPVPRSLLIDDERPAVYCLPGLDQVVLTTGAISRLDPDQLEAVLAHERAHLAGRHHLAVGFASVLAAAFPFSRLFTAASHEIPRLIEMAADDAGSRRAGKLTLARALFSLAAVPVPGDALGASGSGVGERIRRLLEPDAEATVTQRLAINVTRGAAASAATLAVVAAPTVAVLAGCCWSGL
jgi:Zn-dependent protease with chaperone function